MRVVAAVGREALEWVRIVGALSLQLYQILRSLFPPRFDRTEVWRQLNKIGVMSLPIVVLTAMLVGVIMVIQMTTYVHKTGATGFVGWAAGLTVLSELGPSLIGLMFSGRVGANATAELGNMVVSEQIDALRALAIDPIKFLVTPRFLAIVISLVLLTVIGDLFGLIGGAVTSQWLLHVDWKTFIAGVVEADLLDNFVVGLVKAFVFGVVISTVSSTYGLSVQGGAKGVGRAVNGCVVTTAFGIFLSDYLIVVARFKLLE